MVALLGARMHYAAPRILNDAGCLERLFTDLCAIKGLSQCLAFLPRCLAASRDSPSAVARLPGVFRQTRLRVSKVGLAVCRETGAGSPGAGMTSIFLCANRAFGNLVCRSNWSAGNAVFTFNTAGLEIRLARSRGHER